MWDRQPREYIKNNVTILHYKEGKRGAKLHQALLAQPLPIPGVVGPHQGVGLRGVLDLRRPAGLQVVVGQPVAAGPCRQQGGAQQAMEGVGRVIDRIVRSAPGGSLAAAVSEVPKGMLIFTRPLIAQPPRTRAAVVRSAVGSAPAPGAGSVIANADRMRPSSSGSSHCFCWSGVP